MHFASACSDCAAVSLNRTLSVVLTITEIMCTLSSLFSSLLLFYLASVSIFVLILPSSLSQRSPGLELFLNMSEWIEGQRVCMPTHTHTLHNTMMPWHSRNVYEPIGNSRVWGMNEWKEDGYLMRASGVDKGEGEGGKGNALTNMLFLK